MKDNPQKQVFLYDTTLRDGCQAEGFSLSLEEKLQIAAQLDMLGVHYIEGGYPLSNPKDAEFFKQVNKLNLRNSQVSAFGATRRADTPADKDEGLRALLDAQTPAVTIVAKASDLHVNKVLGTTPEENLQMIEDSVKFLKSEGKTVLLDAEHFFDGYLRNPDYALKVAEVSADSGADCVVLCDTNGGALTSQVADITAKVCQNVQASVGVHCHNDCGLAVANSIASIENGADHLQGTLNGLGERCGNTDLCVVIPIIELKTPFTAIGRRKLRKITEVSRFAYETANMMFRGAQPFVGSSAFAHKGGLHVDAMRKDSGTYEHVHPEDVGNERRFLISELSGKAAVKDLFERLKMDPDKNMVADILSSVKEKENEGYQYEAAEGSFALLARRAAGTYRKLFKGDGYHVSTIKHSNGDIVTDATVKLTINGHREHTASEGDGPVNALDGALRKALEHHYPCLKKMQLTDYMVRVINPKAATAAKVRVVIQSADETHTWGTVGVDENIIDASWEALIDSIEYKLLLEKDDEQRR